MLNKTLGHFKRFNILGSYVTLLYKKRFKFHNTYSLSLSMLFGIILAIYSTLLIKTLINFENLNIHQFCDIINDKEILKLKEIPVVIGLKLYLNETEIKNISEYVEMDAKIIQDMFTIDIELEKCVLKNDEIDLFLNNTIYNKEKFSKILNSSNYHGNANLEDGEYQFFCLKINDDNKHFLTSKSLLQFYFQTNNYYKLSKRKKSGLNFKNENLEDNNYSNLNLYVVNMFYSPKINLKNYKDPILDHVHMHYQYFYSGYDKMDYFDIGLGDIKTKDFLGGSFSNTSYEVDIHYSLLNKSLKSNYFSGAMSYALKSFKITYERNYLTLFDLMGKIGGFGNFIFFFFSIFAKYLNRYMIIKHLTIDIMNEFCFNKKKDVFLSDKNFIKNIDSNKSQYSKDKLEKFDYNLKKDFTKKEKINFSKEDKINDNFNIIYKNKEKLNEQLISEGCSSDINEKIFKIDEIKNSFIEKFYEKWNFKNFLFNDNPSNTKYKKKKSIIVQYLNDKEKQNFKENFNKFKNILKEELDIENIILKLLILNDIILKIENNKFLNDWNEGNKFLINTNHLQVDRSYTYEN